MVGHGVLGGAAPARVRGFSVARPAEGGRWSARKQRGACAFTEARRETGMDGTGIAMRSALNTSALSLSHASLPRALASIFSGWPDPRGRSGRRGRMIGRGWSADMQSAPEHRQSIGRGHWIGPDKGPGLPGRTGRPRSFFPHTAGAWPQHKTRPPTDGRTGLGSGLRKGAGAGRMALKVIDLPAAPGTHAGTEAAAVRHRFSPALLSAGRLVIIPTCLMSPNCSAP